MQGSPCVAPKAHRPRWRVNQLRVNHSAFNGYKRTPSRYSEIVCTEPSCLGRWRTDAAYVDSLPLAADVLT